MDNDDKPWGVCPFVFLVMMNLVRRVDEKIKENRWLIMTMVRWISESFEHYFGSECSKNAEECLVKELYCWMKCYVPSHYWCYWKANSTDQIEQFSYPLLGPRPGTLQLPLVHAHNTWAWWYKLRMCWCIKCCKVTGSL